MSDFTLVPSRLHDWHRFAVMKRAFTPEECQALIQIGEAKGTSAGVVQGEAGADGVTDRSVRDSLISWLSREDCAWAHDKLAMMAAQVNADIFRFDLSGFPAIQYTTYSPGQKYEWHQDLGPAELANRKLSLVALLSDPNDYEGGALEIMQGPVLPRERGTVIAFPAYEFHRAAPIENGVRRSLVAWITGPMFR